MDKKLDEYVEEATKNVREDRAVASALLMDLIKHIKSQGEHLHETLGPVVSKYMESLQRSNEQLVKLSTVVQKSTVVKELSDMEKGNVYDLINTEGNG